MPACAACGATLETPLVCSACGVLSSPETTPSPFEVFGLEPTYAIDVGALDKRLLALTRRMHPDFFAADPTQRELAERNTAELNAAHGVLADDFRRADWLVRHLGGPDENTERAMPQAFLMEVLEWNEALEAAREAEPGSAERDLSGLERELSSRRAEVFEALATALTPLPPAASAGGSERLAAIQKQLNAARYVDRALSEIHALALGRPSR